MTTKCWMTVAIVLIGVLSACSDDPTTTDEYRALAQDLETVQQELSAMTGELSQAEASVAEAAAEAGRWEVPADVKTLIDEWSLAIDLDDGSVTDLYWSMGYHLYGDQIIPREDVAAYWAEPFFPMEWITEPVLIAAEPEGRYVVTRGLRTRLGDQTFASAFTFEILDVPEEGLRIAQTDWTWDNSWRYTQW